MEYEQLIEEVKKYKERSSNLFFQFIFQKNVCQKIKNEMKRNETYVPEY